MTDSKRLNGEGSQTIVLPIHKNCQITDKPVMAIERSEQAERGLHLESGCETHSEPL